MFKSLVLISILFTGFVFAGEKTADTAKHESSIEVTAEDTLAKFEKVTLRQFIDNNQLSQKMIDNKQRLMLKPSAITFNAQLLQAPKAGKFSLVYDALQLWPSDQALPKIEHSTFIRADSDKVIGVYLSNAAATQIDALADANTLPINAQFYAIHIYNYAKGPRLVVIGATLEDTL